MYIFIRSTSLFYLLVLFGCLTFLSCGSDDADPKIEIALPTVTTMALSEPSTSGVKSGGTVSGTNTGEITARGVVWGTASAPVISSPTKTVDGTGTGDFVSTLTG